MGITLPLDRVSCPVRCPPQLENKSQASGRPSRTAGLAESRGHRATGRNLLQGVWESHDEILDVPYGDDAGPLKGDEIRI